MTLVLDASLLVALASSEPAGALVEQRLAGWIADDEELHAPALVYYEVAGGLRKAIMSGRMRPEQIGPAVALAEAIPLTIHARSDLAHVVDLAGRTGTQERLRRGLRRARRLARGHPRGPGRPAVSQRARSGAAGGVARDRGGRVGPSGGGSLQAESDEAAGAIGGRWFTPG